MVTGEKKVCGTTSGSCHLAPAGGWPASWEEALNWLERGLLTKEQYEWWVVVRFLRRPVAPFCDFKRYTKCCVIEVADEKQEQPKKKTTPTRKQPKRKLPRVSAKGGPPCHGSEEDFEELCLAFHEMRSRNIPVIEIGGHRGRAAAEAACSEVAHVVKVAGKSRTASSAKQDSMEEHVNFCESFRVRRKTRRAQHCQQQLALWKPRLLSEEDEQELQEFRAQRAARLADVLEVTERLPVPRPPVQKAVTAPDVNGPAKARRWRDRRARDPVDAPEPVAESTFTPVEWQRPVDAKQQHQNRRNFMKTFGRRMQAKQFCDIQRAPAPVDDFTQEELQSFRCRDGAGRLMPGVYGASTGARSLVLARTPKLGSVEDAGSTLGGWSQKCLMNAVLECAPAEASASIRASFLERCANNASSGACGNAVERANFQAVVDALEMHSLRVRVWGVYTAADFERGDVLSCSYLGPASGDMAGDIVWSHMEKHVYVAQLASSLAVSSLDSLCSCNEVQEPWTWSVVGSANASEPCVHPLWASEAATMSSEDHRFTCMEVNEHWGGMLWGKCRLCNCWGDERHYGSKRHRSKLA